MNDEQTTDPTAPGGEGEDPIAVQLPVEIPPEEQEAEESTGEEGGGDVEGSGEVVPEPPVAVPDSASKVAAVVGLSAVKYAAMQLNPNRRGNPDSTFPAWVLSEIDDPDEQWQKIVNEANSRVETLKAGGSSDTYIRHTIAGKIVAGKFG